MSALDGLEVDRKIISILSDLEAIYNAIATARAEKNKPTLIRLTTTIGYGSKQQGTHGVHGARKGSPPLYHHRQL